MSRTFHQWLASTLTNHNSFRAYAEPLVQWIKPGWSAQGIQAQVVNIRPEGSTVFSLVLKPNRKWPGFTAGQHLDLSVNINGRRLMRTFSLSSSPAMFKQTGLIELTIRKQTQGKVTNWLAEGLSVGDQLTLSAARGDFTLPEAPYPMLLIAGGSGITPFRSFLHQLAAEQDNRDVQLIYYNQGKPLFAHEWTTLQQQIPGLQITLIDTDRQDMINREQLAALSPDAHDRTAWLCGPYGLIETARNLLLELGADEQDIHHELFGPRPVDPNLITQAGTVHFSQSGISLNTEQQPRSLLELAEQAQLKPISGCRMGVCHQCSCQKNHGVVYNTLTGQRSDSGSENIQLCVSVPLGDVQLEL